jgi:glycosyltransferase involved in cell wall biosynthesis
MKKHKHNMRILNIITLWERAPLYRGHLAYLQSKGFEAGLCTPPGPLLKETTDRDGAEAFPIPMEREPSPFRDLRSLWAVYRLVRRYRPVIVNAGMPKAGLLGMLAAKLNRVPIRILQQRGLRLETCSGLKRRILYWAEWVSCACATQVLCNSESLQERIIQLKLAPRKKVRVLGAGSDVGVDVERFSRSEEVLAQAATLRKELKIPEKAPVIGYVGRLVRDKGIEELTEAFFRLKKETPDLRLLLVGPFEDEGDPVDSACKSRLLEEPDAILVGEVTDPIPYYAMMDVFALPSYREGFPNVVLEASAMELPTVGFRATGVVDAVHHSKTGLIVSLQDVDGLTDALGRYLHDDDLRQEHGRAARDRVERLFRSEVIWEAFYHEYVSLLRQKGIEPP